MKNIFKNRKKNNVIKKYVTKKNLAYSLVGVAIAGAIYGTKKVYDHFKKKED